MPCSDSNWIVEASRKEDKRKCDWYYESLCKLCNELYPLQSDKIPKDILVWYLEHLKVDTLRMEIDE